MSNQQRKQIALIKIAADDLQPVKQLNVTVNKNDKIRKLKNVLISSLSASTTLNHEQIFLGPQKTPFVCRCVHGDTNISKLNIFRQGKIFCRIIPQSKCKYCLFLLLCCFFCLCKDICIKVLCLCLLF